MNLIRLLMPMYLMASGTAMPPAMAAGPDDPLADILDLYAFLSPICQSVDDAGCEDGSRELVLALTVNPLATGATQFSPDIVYRFYLENDTGSTAEIACSFSREQVVSCAGLNGLSVKARVGEMARSGDIRVFAGLRDDPFFFDRKAFADLASSGLGVFSPPGKDFHAGANVMALVLGVKIGAVPAGSGLDTDIQKIWAASERIASTSLEGAITGAWYNPGQDGQGWLIEVVSSPTGPDQFVTYFYGYDNFGEQLWLLGAGPDMHGNTATVEVMRTSGIGFGSEFDPTSLSLEAVGTMVFSFHDCNSGTVDFTPDDGDWLAFSTDIVRLTNIASVDCRLSHGGQMDREGRPLVTDFFVSERMRQAYQTAADPDTWAILFRDEIAAGIEALDGADGVAGNLLTGDPRVLAEMFADDRLQIDLKQPACTAYGAVELGGLAAQPMDSCGGRAPFYDVVDDTLGWVVAGLGSDVGDYVYVNDADFLAEFPFLAPPHGPVSYEATDWETSTPEAQGLSSEVLADMVEVLLDSRDHYRPHQVVVIRNGQSVLDVAFHPFEKGRLHEIASVGKMITSTLIGIAIDRGYIAGVDEPVLGFFPGWQIANRDARKEAMTLAHLLAQRSGIYHGDDGGHSEEDDAMEASPNWVQWILDRPMASDPGTEYYYSNANLHLAAGILKQATGMAPLEFARRYLYRPLGITSVIWNADPQGVNHGGGGQFHLANDLARLGLLHLDGGKWMGRQVVSPEWVALATSGYPGPHPPGWPPDWSIGFAWAVNDQRGIIETAGSGGQAMRVLRAEDVIIVAVAGGGPAYNDCGANGAVIDSMVQDYVTSAIVGSSPLPPNSQGVARLASLVEQASLPNSGPPVPVPPLPALADSVSGVRFRMDIDQSPLKWLRLTFTGGSEALLEYQETQRVALRVGLDDVYRISTLRPGLLFASKGRWVDERRFAMYLDQPSIRRYYYAELLFEGDSVTLTLEDLACGEETLVLTGHRQV